ncbi:MAG: sensor histidine kinase [Gammaproteobacteria bacterium]|nr:sensor histidine kinase [Gammaproteobacteria bacterium]
MLFLGFYFGTLAMICLINFHWYNVTNEKSYLYLAIFKTFLILITLQTNQIVVINEFSIILNINIIFIYALLFSREFLALNIYAKKMYVAINYTMGFVILYFTYSTITGDYSNYNLPYSLIFSPLFLLSVFIYLRGFEPAKYYALAWGISLSMTGLSDINRFNIANFYPDIPFTLIGHIIESVILSYAISVKTNLIIKEKEVQSKILIHQAKLAAMGHMLENISHQWRQPLNRISAFMINMHTHIKDKYKDEKYLSDALNQSQLQLEYMSNTINDFTNFNKQSTDKENFSVSSVISDVHNIIGPTLEKNSILFDTKILNDFSMVSYPNELAQVILNLIQNAQDALVNREVVQPVIVVIIDKNRISIQDNAGGIDDEIVAQIFEPYFTTNAKTSSLGLGLYMSKIILEKYYNAKIELHQTKQRISFNIIFM